MMAFICCSATSGLALNVSIDPGELAPFVIPGASAGIIRAVRAGWVAAFAVASSSSFASLASFAVADGAGAEAGARAEPRLQASGFVGYSTFGDTELGNSWAPEQVPEASAILGARLGWLAVPDLVRRGRLALSLAVEAELALAPAFTGGAVDEHGRMSYFAPVFGWRAHALLRQPLGPLAIHAVLGAGGATVASSSPFMAKETDPLGYAGLGATCALTDRWQLRLDARQGLMPGRASSATRVSELHAGLIMTFGLAARRAPPPRELAPREPLAATATPEAPPDPTDTDGDGLPDRLDRCPAAPETVKGVDDADGCPEPDPDGDGVLGAADACPAEAEDADLFEDTDGCPDRDNDSDGIEDARDGCPGEPETRNGHADADGCPDAIPDAIVRAFASAAALRFERGRARVTPAGKRALQPLLAALEANAQLAIAIAGTPERAGGEDLAKRRAEAVKWHLVDQGIAEDRIEASVGPPGLPSAIVLRLR
jgi:outer membrane protein OmpA-like peptidoglycan-associated protein